MKILAEKEAEKFLRENAFDVVDGIFVKNKTSLAKLKIKFPLVAKASGKKIIHKKKLGGVVTNIKNSKSLLKAFDKLKKIKGCEEVLLQEFLKGNEFFFGIKKTPEFSHVIVFGKGGSDVEKEKDVAFRVCPVEKKDIEEMISNTKVSDSMSSDEKSSSIKILNQLCRLAEKYPKISELDINPMLNKKIADARIVFE